MCIDIASSSSLALAVQAPCARPLLLLGQASSAGMNLSTADEFITLLPR
jgi:hypothetical protein